jgi:hypothetical protein
VDIGTVEMYKQLITNQSIDVINDVFSAEFISEHDLEKYDKVTILDGKDFNLQLFGYSEFVPDNKDFHVFIFPSRSKCVSLKIFECKF